MNRLITPDGILAPFASGFVDKLAECCFEAITFQLEFITKDALSAKHTSSPFGEFIEKSLKLNTIGAFCFRSIFLRQKTHAQVDHDEISIVDATS